MAEKTNDSTEKIMKEIVLTVAFKNKPLASFLVVPKTDDEWQAKAAKEVAELRQRLYMLLGGAGISADELTVGWETESYGCENEDRGRDKHEIKNMRSGSNS